MPRFGIQCDLHSAIQTLSLTNGFPSKLPWKYLNLMDCNIYEHGSSLSGCTGLLMAQAERWEHPSSTGEQIPAAQGSTAPQHSLCGSAPNAGCISHGGVMTESKGLTSRAAQLQGKAEMCRSCAIHNG